MTKKVNNIPSRQKCIDKEHPYIGGAEKIGNILASIVNAMVC